MIKYKHLLIYTDGSCIHNPGPGGWAALFISDSQEIKTIKGQNPQTTNNIMEMTAAIESLKLCQKNSEFEAEIITIYTDSNYLKNGITLWIKQWKKNNWITASRKPVKNQALWVELDNLCGILKINWIWVKAHSDNYYNNKVDEYAKQMAQLLQR